jgi:hypothetical protein
LTSPWPGRLEFVPLIEALYRAIMSWFRANQPDDWRDHLHRRKGVNAFLDGGPQERFTRSEKASRGHRPEEHGQGEPSGEKHAPETPPRKEPRQESRQADPPPREEYEEQEEATGPSMEVIPFVYGDLPFRAIKDADEPRFILRDICSILKMEGNSAEADIARSLDTDEVFTDLIGGGDGTARKMRTVTFPGLCTVLLKAAIT